MNLLSKNLDIYSIFTLEDGVNYIKSINLNNCNSDDDCPKKSSCIGNKCIVNFFCKNDNNSICSLYQNLCDGKPCYKANEYCENDTDCLSGICHKYKSYYTNYSHYYCEDENDKYSIGFFSYENAKNYFQNIRQCKSDEDCPLLSHCGEDNYCYTNFYCKEGDNNRCSFYKNLKDEVSFQSSQPYDECNKNDDCLSNVCNSTCKRNNFAMVSRKTNKIGLDENEDCTKDKECYAGTCNGTCARRDSDIIKKISTFLIILIIILSIIMVLIIICLCYCCIKCLKK